MHIAPPEGRAVGSLAERPSPRWRPVARIAMAKDPGKLVSNVPGPLARSGAQRWQSAHERDRDLGIALLVSTGWTFTSTSAGSISINRNDQRILSFHESGVISLPQTRVERSGSRSADRSHEHSLVRSSERLIPAFPINPRIDTVPLINGSISSNCSRACWPRRSLIRSCQMSARRRLKITD